MNQRTFIGLVFCSICALAGAVGAADVFLEATRPDFQKIPLGVVSIENTGVMKTLWLACSSTRRRG